MADEQKNRLTPYWQKVMAEADKILQRRIETLKARTLNPEWCLLENDKIRMIKQQWDIQGMQVMRQTVRKGGFFGKLTAFETVLSEKPCLALNLR